MDQKIKIDSLNF